MLVVVLSATLAAAAATLAPALAAPVASAAASASPSSSGAVMARLAEGAARARARYLEGDFAGAVAAADDVNAAFVGAPVTDCPDATAPGGCPRTGPAWGTETRAFDAWADAMATRGLARQRLDDTAGMDATFRALITARPAWQPDRGFVPPRQLQRFEALRQELLSTTMVPLTLTGASDPILDGRVVARGAPIDVIPGPHFVGEGGRGRIVEVTAPLTLAVGAPSSSLLSASGTPDGVAKDGVVAEDGPPWLLIAGGAVGAVVVAGVVVGVVIGLNQPEPAPNPGGTTVVIDASKLNAGAL